MIDLLSSKSFCKNNLSESFLIFFLNGQTYFKNIAL